MELRPREDSNEIEKSIHLIKNPSKSTIICSNPTIVYAMFEISKKYFIFVYIFFDGQNHYFLKPCDLRVLSIICYVPKSGKVEKIMFSSILARF